MFTSKSTHRAHVGTEGRGNGRYAHTVTCTCGRQYGPYNDRTRAEKTAAQHEKTGR